MLTLIRTGGSANEEPKAEQAGGEDETGTIHRTRIISTANASASGRARSGQR